MTGTENPANIQTSEDNISESAELVDYRHGEIIRQVYNISDIRENAEFGEVLKIYNVIK